MNIRKNRQKISLKLTSCRFFTFLPKSLFFSLSDKTLDKTTLNLFEKERGKNLQNKKTFSRDMLEILGKVSKNYCLGQVARITRD